MTSFDQSQKEFLANFQLDVQQLGNAPGVSNGQ